MMSKKIKAVRKSKEFFFYGKHTIFKDDIAGILKTLRSNTISQGKELQKLENKVAKYCKAKYCVAVSSGTAALHMAVLSLNLKKNFLALTSPITFSATANAIILSGGKVDLIDINPETFNLDFKLYKKYIYNQIKNKKKLPELIIPVHIGGEQSYMKEINEISKKNNIKIIEDASQSMGGFGFKKPNGGCEYSNITVFSLHPVKTITAGEGGLILTNDKKIYLNLLYLRSNGLEKKADLNTWEQDINFPGLNYKISELNCSLANTQLKKIKFFLRKRQKIAKYYMDNLNRKIFNFQKIRDMKFSSWHLFIVLIKKKITKEKKEKFFKKLKEKNIFLDIKYKPIHHFTYYKKIFKSKKFKNSDNYFNQSFCLPIYPSLSLKNLRYIVKNINLISERLKI
jgi:UDP-4-amino-4,6-dideoxy-L-N-acetyl-beta-L-altrosamine transaminase